MGGWNFQEEAGRILKMSFHGEQAPRSELEPSHVMSFGEGLAEASQRVTAVTPAPSTANPWLETRLQFPSPEGQRAEWASLPLNSAVIPQMLAFLPLLPGPPPPALCAPCGGTVYEQEPHAGRLPSWPFSCLYYTIGQHFLNVLLKTTHFLPIT